MPELDEVEPIDYQNALLKWKWLIFGGTLAAAIIALVVSLGNGRTYEATVTLEIVEAKAPSLEAILKSQSIALQTIQQFGLDKEPFAMTPFQFLNNAISTTHLRGANMLRLTVVLPNPNLAANVANFVAQKAVESIAQSSQTDAAAIRNELQRQLDQVRQTMNTAQSALAGFKRTAKLESLRTEQRVLLDRKAWLVRLYSDLTIDLNGLRAEVAELRQALAKQEQFLTVNKSIISEPSMLAAAQERGAADLKALSSIQLKDQEVNEVYQALQRDLIRKEAALASMERRRQDVERQLKEQAHVLIATESKIEDADARLEELTTRYSAAQRAYELVAKKNDEVSFSVASRASEPKVVDPAVTPTAPRGRKIMQNVALASIAALAVCTGSAFFLEYLQETKKRREKILNPASSRSSLFG